MQSKPRLTERVLDGLGVIAWIADGQVMGEERRKPRGEELAKMAVAGLWLARMRLWRKEKKGKGKKGKRK